LVPVLETERLRLRGHALADFEASAAMWGDAGVTRFIGGKPSTREESWARFIRYPGHWHLLGHGFWLIEEKASGRFVGECGFGSFKRDVDPPIEGPEQGWALAPWAHGKGYANEAVQAAIAWGEDHFGPVAFACMIAPENTASLRLAEKNGYREYVRTTYKGEPSILLRRKAQ
jgi:RimJ/RimL family protein N-acetyltransferase